jgi:hypothetical protein
MDKYFLRTTLLSLFIAVTVTVIPMGLVARVNPSTHQEVHPTLFALLAVSYFPVILIWTNAFFTFVRGRQIHPKVSSCALLGMGLLFANQILRIVVGFTFPRLDSSGWSSDSIAAFAVVSASVHNVLAAGGWWCLFLAIVGWRNTPREHSA